MNGHGPKLAALLLCLLSAPGCSSRAERAAEASAAFSAHYSSGNYVEARAAILRAIGERDDVPEYWIALARAQIALNEYGGAFAAYSRALELDKANVEALQALADLSLMGLRLRDAQRYNDQLLLLNPSSNRALLNRGFIALARKSFSEAEDHAETILAANPMDEGALILKARTLAESGQPAPGAETLERALRIRGGSRPMAETLLGIYESVGDEDGMRRTRARLVAIAPQDPGLKIDYASALFKAGEGRQAFELTKKVLQDHPDEAVAERVADLWIEAGVPAVPLEEVVGLGQLASAAQRLALARFLIHREAFSEAKRLLQPLLKTGIGYSNVSAAALYASAQYALGERRDARRLLNRAHELDKSNPAALRSRAQISAKEGNLPRALADAQVLVREQPGSPADRILLATIYEAKGATELAELTYAKAFAELPATPSIYQEYSKFLLAHDPGSVPALTEQFRQQQLDARRRRYEIRR